MRMLSLSASVIAGSILAAGWSPIALSADTGRATIPFDQDWRFHLGEVAGGQKPELDDAAWRKLDLPHDWAIEGPFDRKSPATHEGGYLNGGVGWYRKTFTLPPEAKGRRVRSSSTAPTWTPTSGSTASISTASRTATRLFIATSTPQLTLDGPNVLAVRLAVAQPCSRWYSGGGIYRHVRLTLLDPVHIAPWGVCVTTPEITAESAEVSVHSELVNQGKAAADVHLETIVLDPQGEAVAKNDVEQGPLEGGDPVRIGIIRKVNATPACGAPSMFRSRNSGRSRRRSSTPSCRGSASASASWTSAVHALRHSHDQVHQDQGFFLNGRRVQLQGVCNHHDLGCLGAAVHRRAIQRQLEILKGMGCNAIRTSHNPPAPELLDLCDRMGFVVMDEAFDEWKLNKEPLGYGRFFDQWSEQDLTSMLRRDRNHPCIVLWSIGNEIPEQNASDGGADGQTAGRHLPSRGPDAAGHLGVQRPRRRRSHGLRPAAGRLWHQLHDRRLPTIQRPHAGRARRPPRPLSTRGEYNLAPEPDGKLRIETPTRQSSDLLRPGVSLLGLHGRAGPAGRGGGALGGGRVRLDRLRLHRRTDALRLALAQLVLRHRRSLRLSQGSLLSLSQPLAARAAGAPAAALDLAGLGRQVDPGLVHDQLRRC